MGVSSYCTHTKGVTKKMHQNKQFHVKKNIFTKRPKLTLKIYFFAVFLVQNRFFLFSTSLTNWQIIYKMTSLDPLKAF